MLRLNLQKGPAWFDLGHGVRIECLPLTSTIMSGARRDPEFVAAIQGLPLETMTEETARAALLDTEAGDQMGVALAKAVARKVIVSWEGVAGMDDEPMPVTPEAVSALLDLFPMFEAFQLKYLNGALRVDAEKNASSPSLNGTLAAATTTAVPAQDDATIAQAC